MGGVLQRAQTTPRQPPVFSVLQFLAILFSRGTDFCWKKYLELEVFHNTLQKLSAKRGQLKTVRHDAKVLDPQQLLPKHEVSAAGVQGRNNRATPTSLLSTYACMMCSGLSPQKVVLFFVSVDDRLLV